MDQSSSLPPHHSKKPSSVLPYKTPNVRDHYRVGKKLGQGQFGTTYLCVDKASGKEYACKSIPKRKLLCREDYEDVWREIQIMHHLSEHPNVVRIKGTYEDPLFVHLVMELCAGGELFDRIIQKGHYSERKAAQLIKTIVGVVEGCHSLGVMHRDLKPENFLFASQDEDAALRATDFGLSMFYKPGRTFVGDTFSDVVGSPYYVAPEVLRKYYGPEADVWSAGLEREENLVSAFSFFDKDGSGYITVDELSQACRDFGLDDVHLDDMIKEIDQDNVRSISVIFSGHWFLRFPIKLFSTVCLQDGQIDYNEFAAMMRKGNGDIGRRTMRNSLRINLGDALKITER
ncbi:hypothetical protein B296_00001151 [Ensete ventricosum]|uniref:non-specific serine/threonine protein kinase n=1 Tax=Ensete ventricosum TaxID=4639 RepID=A0A427APA4_ENSVE|nr:hypothetical protein B296_00001151 [Ensete ventricosum]